MRTSDEVINCIKEIRSQNNELWMDILKIAFEFAPEQAKTVFKKIAENDTQITELSKELGDD